MSLSKEAIAECIEQNIADDYHRFDYICSEVTVINFEQFENSLIVEYSFWDDGHATGDQSYYLFDLDNEYGVNFPASMQHIKIKAKLTWESSAELESLNANFYEEDIDPVDITIYYWGDPEIDEWIEHYLQNDPEHLALMLIEHYHADTKMPEFIPACLIPYFQKIVAEYS